MSFAFRKQLLLDNRKLLLLNSIAALSGEFGARKSYPEVRVGPLVVIIPFVFRIHRSLLGAA
jgi:hypothetical protein